MASKLERTAINECPLPHKLTFIETYYCTYLKIWPIPALLNHIPSVIYISLMSEYHYKQSLNRLIQEIEIGPCP